MTFTADPTGIHHLGTPLSRNEGLTARGLCTRILQHLRRGSACGQGTIAASWAALKRVLLSAYTYQVAFLPIPPHLVYSNISAAIYASVAANRVPR